MAFISKKHLSRRTFLNGMGVTIALPFLESMVPAATPLAQTSASAKTRLGCIYVPHGATMDKWTPATEGAGFEYTEILKPLEQFRERITIVSGLAHPYVAGAAARRAGPPRRVRRPGSGAAHRSGHAAAVAGALDRRGGAGVRGELQL